MAASADVARASHAWAWLKLRWPTLEVRELVVFLFVVQLMTSARLFTLAIGAPGFTTLCSGVRIEDSDEGEQRFRDDAEHAIRSETEHVRSAATLAFA